MKVPLIVLLFALASSAHAGDSDVAAKGRALIQQAEDKTNIFALTSFRMIAKVHIDNFGKPLEGNYALLWNGPDQWREEIAFPGYSEVQVGDKGVIHVKRNTEFPPYRVSQLHLALGYGSNAATGGRFDQEPQQDETIKSVRHEKVAGQAAECVKIAGADKGLREVCVDASTGLINRHKGGYADGQFTPIDSKVFPRLISLTKAGEHVVEVEITQFEGEPKFNPDLFIPPAGAVSRDGCMNPTRGTVIKRVQPEYPEMAKAARIQGVVATEVLVDKNGAVGNVRVVFTSSPLLNQATIDAVKQWRFQPSSCAGRPVELETMIETNYTLAY